MERNKSGWIAGLEAGGEVADSLLSIGKRDPRENMWRTISKRYNIIELLPSEGSVGKHIPRSALCAGGTLPSTDMPRSACALWVIII